MRSMCFLLCISGVVHADIIVQKLLYLETRVDGKDAVSGEGLPNTLEDLKKVLCLPGKECQDKKNHQGTTYRPFDNYPSQRPWYTTSPRPNDRPTRRPRYTTTYRPYYPYKTTRRYWNSTTYESDETVPNNKAYTPSTPFNETWTSDYFDEEEKVLVDCSDLPAFSPSGLYNIRAEDGQVEVFCDMETDGGNWTVIQSHNVSSPLNMNNSWDEYKYGFGVIKEVFWLGNKQISEMATRRRYSLRVEMTDVNGYSSFAKYEMFQVTTDDDNFRLNVKSYSGNAEDGLLYNDGRPFSTYDLDNDHYGTESCPQMYGGGWWYRSCSLADLNGYEPRWLGIKLVNTEMKIRPAYL